MLTRRLFAKRMPLAPLAADAVLQARAAQPQIFSVPLGGGGGVPNGAWSLAHKLMHDARTKLRVQEHRAGIMGGLDPDIMALRSISPSHKARMLAERRLKMDEDAESIWQWAKRKAGLPDDA